MSIVQNCTAVENFTHNVSWLREHYGLSKKRMSALLGIGTESLNKLEKGIIPKNLSVKILVAIHTQFGFSPAQQFGQRLGEDDANIKT